MASDDRDTSPVRVHLVDGTYELFRSHFSPRPGTTAPDGTDVKATVGVLRGLLALLEDTDEAPTHLAVAFDNPIESFRNDLFDGYKTGDGIEEPLRAQFDLAERAVAALGVHVWSCDGHEADDALASAAVQLAAAVAQVRVLTPDKDLAQVVSGTHVVQVDRMRDRLFDADGVVERLGVVPTSVPDYLALVGDTADGIPGLKGFGAKGTAAVLGRYPHLEDVPAEGRQWDVDVRGAARLAQTLADNRDAAMLYRDLATLRCDLDLGVTLDELRWTGPTEAWPDLCAELGRPELAERVPAGR